MRPSANRHVLAILRGILKMNQTDFSEVADCSTSTIQAIELKRLKLSESLAAKISVATNISRSWLLDNNLKTPPVTASGRPYTRDEYTKAQANRKPWDGSETMAEELAFVFYAEIRAIFAAVTKKDFGDFRIMNYELKSVLESLAKKYGRDEKLYPQLSDEEVAKGKRKALAFALAKDDVTRIVQRARELEETRQRWASLPPGSLKVIVDEAGLEKALRTGKNKRRA